MSTTSPRPDDPRPLDEEEQRALDRIGRDLAGGSPELHAALTAPPRPARHGLLDDLLALAAALVILGLVLPSAWFAVVIIVLAMGGPVLLAARFESLRHPGAGTGATEGRPRDDRD